LHKYAQIDELTGICVGVSILSGKVVADHMVLMDEDSLVKPGDIYKDGEWIVVDIPDPEPELDRIGQLEFENLELKLALAELAEVQQTNNSRWLNWLKF